MTLWQCSAKHFMSLVTYFLMCVHYHVVRITGSCCQKWKLVTNARCSVDWVTHHMYLMNSAGSMYELLYGGKTGRLAGNGYWRCFKLTDSMARSMTSQASDLSILFSFHWKVPSTVAVARLSQCHTSLSLFTLFWSVASVCAMSSTVLLAHSNTVSLSGTKTTLPPLTKNSACKYGSFFYNYHFNRAICIYFEHRLQWVPHCTHTYPMQPL